MSGTEGGLVTAYADAWRRGDIAALAELYAEDIVVHYGGASAFAGTHTGRQTFLEVLLETALRSNRQLVEIDDVFDLGTSGAIFARESIAVDGVVTTVRRCLRYRVSDGRLVECWLYDHDQHLVDRSWAPREP